MMSVTPLTIGAMYRLKGSWDLYTEPFRNQPIRTRVGTVRLGHICQLIEINRTDHSHSIRVLSGLQLGWISFYKDVSMDSILDSVLEEVKPQ